MAARPSSEGAAGLIDGEVVAARATMAIDGKVGISPWQGSGVKAGVAGLAPKLEEGTCRFCQWSHDSVCARTGRSGT